MEIVEELFDSAYLLKPKIFNDNRGYFFESFSESFFEKNNIHFKPVQDNESYNIKKNTLRGIHFQINPKAQAKLVRCVKGSILDVLVDLRPESKTFGEWKKVILDDKEKFQLLVPKNFGHAFLTLEDDVLVNYKVDEFYHQASEGSIKWNDETLKINWGITEQPVISEKDDKAQSFIEFSKLI